MRRSSLDESGVEIVSKMLILVKCTESADAAKSAVKNWM